MFQELTSKFRCMLTACAAVAMLTGGAAFAQPTGETGACCIRPNTATTECIVTTAADCAARQGLFRGVGTVCGALTAGAFALAPGRLLARMVFA